MKFLQRVNYGWLHYILLSIGLTFNAGKVLATISRISIRDLIIATEQISLLEIEGRSTQRSSFQNLYSKSVARAVMSSNPFPGYLDEEGRSTSSISAQAGHINARVQILPILERPCGCRELMCVFSIAYGP